MNEIETGALAKFLQRLKAAGHALPDALEHVGKMPIGTAMRKLGEGAKKTGGAMLAHPRAALGAGALGAAAGYAAHGHNEDEDDEELQDEALKRYMVRQGMG